MKSGVYRLTFPSGACYVGKSVDIEARWKQHANALSKGRAAAALQAEFARSGFPTGTVLFHCHPDHIDLVEAVFIARQQPELNTSRPPDPFPDVDDMQQIFELLHESTHEHLNTIFRLQAQQRAETAAVQQLTAEVTALKITRSQKEVNVEKDRKIRDLREDVVSLKSRIVDLQKLVADSQKPWWRKIF